MAEYPRLTFRLPEELAERLAQVADERKVSRGSLVVAALESSLGEGTAAGTPRAVRRKTVPSFGPDAPSPAKPSQGRCVMCGAAGEARAALS